MGHTNSELTERQPRGGDAESLEGREGVGLARQLPTLPAALDHPSRPYNNNTLLLSAIAEQREAQMETKLGKRKAEGGGERERLVSLHAAGRCHRRDQTDPCM